MPKKSSIDMGEVRRLLEVDKLSTYGVAEKIGCNQSHIVRLIAKFNKANPNNPIKKRDKSEAQKNFIDRTGGHQRDGTIHSDETKEKISDSMKEVYDSPAGDEIRTKIAEKRQQEWATLTDVQKAEILQNLKKSSRAATQSGDGSKFENFLAESLQAQGYSVVQRTKAYTPGNKFHVDIALPNEKIIIEVDGPTHWSPIYGDAELQKVQAKDTSKDNILLSNGWKILRVQDASGSTTRARFLRVAEQLDIMKKYQGQPSVFYIKP